MSKKTGAACMSAAVPAIQLSELTNHCWDMMLLPRMRRRCRNFLSTCLGRSAREHASSSLSACGSSACMHDEKQSEAWGQECTFGVEVGACVSLSSMLTIRPC